jgi:hypothetical protein
MVMALIFGLMVDSIVVNGLVIIWMDKGPIYGRMDVNMKDNILTIKSMDLEHIHGIFMVYNFKNICIYI